MYHHFLKRQWIETIRVIEKHQNQLDQIIENAIGGIQGEIDINNINGMIEYYKKIENHEIDAVILGCTELPLTYSQKDTNIKVISSNRVLAEALVEKAKSHYI